MGAGKRDRAERLLSDALQLASQYGLESGVSMEDWIYDTANILEAVRAGARTDWRKHLEQIQEVPV